MTLAIINYMKVWNAHAMVIAGLAAACTSAPPGDSAATADSLSLERTVCFGTCPIYRVSLSRSGNVVFESPNPGDPARAQRSVARETLDRLVERANQIGFFSLPDTIRTNQKYCTVMATDHPSAIVTIYRSDGVKTVIDYHGCYANTDGSVINEIRQLREFQNAVDSATGSRQWVKPARIR